MRIAGQLLRGWGPVATATPTLAIADHADGTGATATITGAVAGSTVEVFTVAVDADFDAPQATSAGSRTSNGTLALALDPGAYWAYAVATLGGVAVSNLVYFFVTSGEESLQQRILEAVQARIRNLSLPNLGSENVVIRSQPWDRNLTKPSCVIVPVPEEIPWEEGTNFRDRIGYAVAISFVRSTHENLAASRDELFQWRRRGIAAFRNQRLTGVPEVFMCLVEPAAVIEPEAFDKGLDVSGFVVRCLSYEARGL